MSDEISLAFGKVEVLFSLPQSYSGMSEAMPTSGAASVVMPIVEVVVVQECSTYKSCFIAGYVQLVG
jgi:hypothetical protein